MASTPFITALRCTAVAGLVGAAGIGLGIGSVSGSTGLVANHPHTVMVGQIRLLSDDEPADDGAGATDEHADDHADLPADPAPEADAPGTAPEAEAAAEAPIDATADVAEVPDTADGADADLAAALESEPVAADIDTASAAELQEITESVSTEVASTEVTQWNSAWMSYDAYYRPVIANPYGTALSIVYTYDNAPRIVTVAPQQRVVIDAPATGVYDFTALTRTPQGATTNVSVGSFTGGGYVPAAGQPGPAKPAPLPTQGNVLVQIRYNDRHSAPFRVQHLVDLGDDAAVQARRVLIDGTTSAWGQWGQNARGERQFTITTVLALPGLAGPAQAPLPGYKVALVKN
jgi:hypothetical protein